MKTRECPVPTVGKRPNRLYWIEVIPRMWARGGDAGPNEEGVFLLRPADKKMCCMGFAALFFGAKKEEIAEQTDWGTCTNEVLKEVDLPDPEDYQIFQPVYTRNDDFDSAGKKIPDASRIRLINSELAAVKANFRFRLATKMPAWLRRAR